MDKRPIRSYMRRARRRVGLTQKQLAPKIPVSLRRYGDIERGQKDPNSRELEAFALLLGENLWITQEEEKKFQADCRRYHREARECAAGQTDRRR